MGISSVGSRSSCDSSTAVTCKCALAKPRGSIPKCIINGALNITVGIVLFAGFCVQRILVPVEATGIKAYLVSICSHSDSLGAGSVGVCEVDVVRLEVGADDVCRGRSIQVAGSCGGHAPLDVDDIVLLVASAKWMVNIQI